MVTRHLGLGDALAKYCLFYPTCMGQATSKAEARTSVGGCSSYIGWLARIMDCPNPLSTQESKTKLPIYLPFDCVVPYCRRRILVVVPGLALVN